MSWLLRIMLQWNERADISLRSDFNFLDTNLEVELLGHLVVLFLMFWETFILVFIVATPIHIATNSIQGFPHLTSSPILISSSLIKHINMLYFLKLSNGKIQHYFCAIPAKIHNLSLAMRKHQMMINWKITEIILQNN